MKTILLLVAVVACVCAAYAVPVREEHDAEAENTIRELADASPHVSFSILGKVARWVPWGTVIDGVIEGVKKVKEMVSN